MRRYFSASVLILTWLFAACVSTQAVDATLSIEGEDLTALSSGAGDIQTQDMSMFRTSSISWSNSAHLWWTNAHPGDRLILGFDVPQEDTYTVAIHLTRAENYAIVDLSIDEEVVASGVDLYDSEVIPSGAIALGTHTLAPGQHELKIEITGKNQAAVAHYMVGVDRLTLEPVASGSADTTETGCSTCGGDERSPADEEEAAAAEDEESEPAGQALAMQTFALGFFDPFDRWLRPEWEWINEDPGAWRVTPDGNLEIDLAESSLYQITSGRNVLVQDVPGTDFTAEAHILFEPTQNFQYAGIVVMADNRNSFVFGRIFAEGDDEWACPGCKGNAITFSHVADGRFIQSQDVVAYMTLEPSNEAYLKIVLENGLLTALFSEDGAEWTTMTFDVLTWQPAKVGLFTSTGGQPVGDISAQFDYFAMQEGVTEITWYRAPIPVGRARGAGAHGAGEWQDVCSRVQYEAFNSDTGALLGSFDRCCCSNADWKAFDTWWDRMGNLDPNGMPTEVSGPHHYDICGGSGLVLTAVILSLDDGSVLRTGPTSPCFCSSYDDIVQWMSSVAYVWVMSQLEENCAKYDTGDGYCRGISGTRAGYTTEDAPCDCK